MVSNRSLSIEMIHVRGHVREIACRYAVRTFPTLKKRAARWTLTTTVRTSAMGDHHPLPDREKGNHRAKGNDRLYRWPSRPSHAGPVHQLREQKDGQHQMDVQLAPIDLTNSGARLDATRGSISATRAVSLIMSGKK